MKFIHYLFNLSFLIVVCLIILNPIVNGRTFVIASAESNESILYVGGMGPGNYTYIQDAIDNASDGDTVFVYSGVYSPSERLNVTKEITILGESKSSTFIKPDQKLIIAILSNNVKIKNFALYNVAIFSNMENVIIENNHIKIQNVRYSSSDSTIKLMGEKAIVTNNTLLFSDVTFDYAWDAISVYGSICQIIHNMISFHECSVEYHCNAIHLKEADNCEVTNNIISGSFYGIMVDDSGYVILENAVVGHNLIRKNTVMNCSCGIYYNPCLLKKYHSDITMNNLLNNTVNADFGVSVPSLEWFIRSLIPDDENTIMWKTQKNDNSMDLFDDGYVWEGNYYDDYNGMGPKIIHGTIRIRGIFDVFPGF